MRVATHLPGFFKGLLAGATLLTASANSATIPSASPVELNATTKLTDPQPVYRSRDTIGVVVRMENRLHHPVTVCATRGGPPRVDIRLRDADRKVYPSSCSGLLVVSEDSYSVLPDGASLERLLAIDVDELDLPRACGHYDVTTHYRCGPTGFDHDDPFADLAPVPPVPIKIDTRWWWQRLLGLDSCSP